MSFLPKALGMRPRLAVEVRAEGVVAARAEDASGVLMAISRADLPEGALAPGLKAGNVADKKRVAASIRSALNAVAGGAGHDVTLVVPDAAVRVLLLDFDTLPSKAAEAMAVVRFRLKKLLPFEVEDAQVSYQQMPSADGVVVLAVAIPREVLTEYEGVVSEAGYTAGAVLPSTLAALAALGRGDGAPGEDTAALALNAGAQQVTTAIVRGGVLLLHRTLEVTPAGNGAGMGSASKEPIEAEAVMQSETLREMLPQMAESIDSDVAQAVSIAAAYYEDTLAAAPTTLLAAGTASAEHLERVLHRSGIESLRVREVMTPEMIAAGAATATVPRGWLTGVKGALTN